MVVVTAFSLSLVTLRVPAQIACLHLGLTATVRGTLRLRSNFAGTSNRGKVHQADVKSELKKEGSPLNRAYFSQMQQPRPK